MQTLQNQLIEKGLKIWEKGNVKRIYVKADTIKKIIDFEENCQGDSFLEKNTKAIFQRINSNGAWLNCDNDKFESKKATVQNWFENSEFSEKFGY